MFDLSHPRSGLADPCWMDLLEGLPRASATGASDMGGRICRLKRLPPELPESAKPTLEAAPGTPGRWVLRWSSGPRSTHLFEPYPHVRCGDTERVEPDSEKRAERGEADGPDEVEPVPNRRRQRQVANAWDEEGLPMKEVKTGDPEGLDGTSMTYR